MMSDMIDLHMICHRITEKNHLTEGKRLMKRIKEGIPGKRLKAESLSSQLGKVEKGETVRGTVSARPRDGRL